MLFLIGGFTVLLILLVIAYPTRVAEILTFLIPSAVWRVQVAQPILALTFDDGPDPIYTPEVLRILAEQHVRATFFLVGERARSYPEIVAAIRKAGHEIGNHSFSWRRTISLGGTRFEEDLLRAESALGLEQQRKFFRPAGILFRAVHPLIAKSHGYITVLGSGYAFDPYRPPVNFIVWAISRAMRPGAILVLHDSGGNRINTVKALPKIIQAARLRGLDFKCLSEII